MEIKIECPWCNQKYSVDESLNGQKVECSVCEKEFIVRNPNDSTPSLSTNSIPDTKTAEAVAFRRTTVATSSGNKSTNVFSKEKHYQEKTVLMPKSNDQKWLIGSVIIVICSIVICVFFYIKSIPEKEYKKGYKAYNEHHYIEAVEHLQKAAKSGYSEAQVLLGLCYANGDGISRNVDEAVQWFRRAAEQNNPEAQYRMGLSYLAGIGVNPREEEGIFWLQKAIEQGHHKAQISLGDLYYVKGDRLPFLSESAKQYFSKALECYQKASKTGPLSEETRGKMFTCQLSLDQTTKGRRTTSSADGMVTATPATPID